MPHYLTPMSSVTTATTCQLEGLSPRRPKTRLAPEDCPCTSCSRSSTDTNDGSRSSQESVVPPESQSEIPAEMETIDAVNQYADAEECLGEDDSFEADDTTIASNINQGFPIKPDPSDESSVGFDISDDSPLKVDLSSDASPSKSAISADSSTSVKSINADTSSNESGGRLDSSASPESPVLPPATQSSPVLPAATPGSPPTPLSLTRLQAVSEAIDQSGQSSPRRRPRRQPRDFSRERPTGIRYIRRLVKRIRRRKSTNPKRQRNDSADTELMRTTFFPCD